MKRAFDRCSTKRRDAYGNGAALYTPQLADPFRVEVDYLTPPTPDAFGRGALFVNLQVNL